MTKRLIPVLILLFLPSLMFGFGSVRVTSTFGGKGEGDGEFAKESHWAFDSDGNIYVSDGEMNRVQKLSPDGNLILKITQPEEGAGFKFRSISDIDVDDDGNIYVVDWKIKQRDDEILYDYIVCVHVFSSDGKFIRDIDLPELGSPTDKLAVATPAVTPDGRNGFIIPHGDPKRTILMQVVNGEQLIVFDAGQIKLFKFDGSLEKQFDCSSAIRPVDMAADSDSIWITDEGDHRLLRYDRATGLAKAIGEYGYGRGKFIAPYWVSICNDGNIAVLDRAVLKRFDATGFDRRDVQAIADPDLPESLFRSTSRIERTLFRRVQRFSKTGEFIGQNTVKLDRDTEEFEILGVSPSGDIYLQDRETLRIVRTTPTTAIADLISSSRREIGVGVDRIISEIEIDNPDDLDAKRDWLDEMKAVGINSDLSITHDLDERIRLKLQGQGYYIFFRIEDRYAQMDRRTSLNQDDKTIQEINGATARLDIDVKLSPEPRDLRRIVFYLFAGYERFDYVNDALSPSNNRYGEWNLTYADWGGGITSSLNRDWYFDLSVFRSPAGGSYDYDGIYIDEDGMLFATLSRKGTRTIIRFALEGGFD